MNRMSAYLTDMSRSRREQREMRIRSVPQPPLKTVCMHDCVAATGWQQNARGLSTDFAFRHAFVLTLTWRRLTHAAVSQLRYRTAREHTGFSRCRLGGGNAPFTSLVSSRSEIGFGCLQGLGPDDCGRLRLSTTVANSCMIAVCYISDTCHPA